MFVTRDMSDGAMRHRFKFPGAILIAVMLVSTMRDDAGGEQLLSHISGGAVSSSQGSVLELT